MSDKMTKKKPLVPRLRFPEFRDSGEWKVKALRELAARTTKKNHDALQTRVLTNSAEFGVVDQREFFDKDIANKDNLAGYYIVEKGDYVYNPRISTTAPVGPISKNSLGTGVMSPLYTVFRFTKDNTEFYSYYFKTSKWHAYMRQASSTGARHDRMSITTNVFMHLPIPVAPSQEQQKIADCLSSLDELIGSECKNLSSLKAHKTGLMQKLFPNKNRGIPRKRFPEFANMDNWEYLSVGSIFRVTRGEVLAMPNIKEEASEEFPYPVYSSQTKNNGLAGYYSKYLYEDAITWTTDGANAGEVNFRNGKFFCTNVCGVLINTQGYANTFTAALLNTITRDHVSYVGNPKLMNGVMSDIIIPLPLLPEQQKIADCLSSLDELIAAQGRKIELLKLQKMGLMQQLFVVL